MKEKAKKATHWRRMSFTVNQLRALRWATEELGGKGARFSYEDDLWAASDRIRTMLKKDGLV